jgi:hypothetical protein
LSICAFLHGCPAPGLIDISGRRMYHPAHSFACKDRMSCQELYEKGEGGFDVMTS